MQGKFQSQFQFSLSVIYTCLMKLLLFLKVLVIKKKSSTPYCQLIVQLPYKC